VPKSVPEKPRELTEFQRNVRRLLLGSHLSEAQNVFLEEHLQGAQLSPEKAAQMRPIFLVAQHAVSVAGRASDRARNRAHQTADERRVLLPEELRLLNGLIGSANGQEPSDLPTLHARHYKREHQTIESLQKQVQRIVAKAARLAH
jgi:hypothetical protein